MSGPKIFITGATGYVGGDVLHVFTSMHPDWQITCLVRSEAKAQKISDAYPSVRTVQGDLSQHELLEREAEAALVVLHFADSNEVAPINAIVTGMKRRKTPGFLLHTSGTGILFYPDVDADTYGQRRDKVWDDVADIHEINAIPHHALHREADEAVFAAGAPGSGLNATIVCPPLIYGVGRGPDSKRSQGLPMMARAILERGQGFKVGAGESIWSNVHIYDLSRLYLLLTEEAVEGGDNMSWGHEGYYFANSGEHVWGDLAKAVTATAHGLGYLDSKDTVSLDIEDANKIFMYGAMMWGTNSRSKASRAKEEFGWKAREASVDDPRIVRELIEVEKRALTQA